MEGSAPGRRGDFGKQQQSLAADGRASPGLGRLRGGLGTRVEKGRDKWGEGVETPQVGRSLKNLDFKRKEIEKAKASEKSGVRGVSFS